jgi:hypothetical protein
LWGLLGTMKVMLRCRLGSSGGAVKGIRRVTLVVVVESVGFVTARVPLVVY